MSEVKVERHSSRSRCMSCKALLNARRACDKPGCPMFISAEELAIRDFRAAIAEAEQRGYRICLSDVVAWLDAWVAGRSDLTRDQRRIIGAASHRISRGEHIGASDSKEEP